MKKRLHITNNAPVVLGFVALCGVVLLADILTGGLTTNAFFMTYRYSFKSPLMYIRLFTHVLGHAGWAHFIGNMSYILLLGPMLEEKYGGKRLIQVIVVTALVTGVINNVFFPNVALCGASGVVFAFILLASFTSFKEGEIPLTFLLVAAIYLGQQIHDGLTVDDNISNMAHIFGGIVGSVCGYQLNKRSRRVVK